jgi:hypothetical protein
MDRLIHSEIRLVGSRPPQPACQLGPSCGRCEQAERAGLLDRHAAAMRAELLVQVTHVRLNHQNM